MPRKVQGDSAPNENGRPEGRPFRCDCDVRLRVADLALRQIENVVSVDLEVRHHLRRAEVGEADVHERRLLVRRELYGRCAVGGGISRSRQGAKIGDVEGTGVGEDRQGGLIVDAHSIGGLRGYRDDRGAGQPAAGRRRRDELADLAAAFAVAFAQPLRSTQVDDGQGVFVDDDTAKVVKTGAGLTGGDMSAVLSGALGELQWPEGSRYKWRAGDRAIRWTHQDW